MQLQGLKFSFKQKAQKKRQIRPWSPEEDQQLLKLWEMAEGDWHFVASRLENRNMNQCLHRYRRISKSKIRKEAWSRTEDQLVRNLVENIGHSWSVIASKLRGKTGKQVRERYVNKLDPSIRKDNWTTKEDHLIIEMYNSIGTKWNIISRLLPGRPQNLVKNRFYSHIKRFYQLENGMLSSTVLGEQNIKKQAKKQAVDLPLVVKAEAPTTSVLKQAGFQMMPMDQPLVQFDEYLMPEFQPKLMERSSFFKDWDIPDAPCEQQPVYSFCSLISVCNA